MHRQLASSKAAYRLVHSAPGIRIRKQFSRFPTAVSTRPRTVRLRWWCPSLSPQFCRKRSAFAIAFASIWQREQEKINTQRWCFIVSVSLLPYHWGRRVRGQRPTHFTHSSVGSCHVNYKKTSIVQRVGAGSLAQRAHHGRPSGPIQDEEHAARHGREPQVQQGKVAQRENTHRKVVGSQDSLPEEEERIPRAPSSHTTRCFPGE